MNNILIYPAGETKACQYAAQFLQQAGIETIDHPSPDVTHLLLDIPSFAPGGILRGGGELPELMRMLPVSTTVIGGNLKHPYLEGRPCIDLLTDEVYLARNAGITALCAMQIASSQMELTFSDAPTLIIGWGRIGKCLARLLRPICRDLTIAARKEADRGLLHALGYQSIRIPDIQPQKYRLLFNTAPELLLTKAQTKPGKNCLMIDLASKPGMEGDSVIWAKGLPGVYAPESSGTLIAQRTLYHIGRK